MTAAPPPVANQPRRALRWPALVLGVLATFLTLASAAAIMDGGGNILRLLVGEAEAIDALTVLSALELILALVGVAGAWMTLARRRLVWTVLFLLIQLPAPFVIEANRCDAHCESTAWAMLPQSVWRWRISLREPKPARAAAAPAAPRHLTHRLAVWPQGAELPPSFVSQAATSTLGGHNMCFAEWAGEQPCDAYLLDLYGDGEPTVMLVAPEDRSEQQIAGEVFRRRADGGWARTAEFVVKCADSIAALRKGQFALSTPKAPEVVVSGRAFSLLPDPDYACPKPAA